MHMGVSVSAGASSMSQTQIFMNYEEFKQRKDLSINGMDANFAKTHRFPNLMNCEGCWCCTNLTKCKYMTKCNNCRDCTMCFDSSNLIGCTQCKDCTDLKDCTECYMVDNYENMHNEKYLRLPPKRRQ